MSYSYETRKRRGNWDVQYQDGNKWKPVPGLGHLPLKLALLGAQQAAKVQQSKVVRLHHRKNGTFIMADILT